MTDAEILTDFLVRRLGKAYCDNCLSQELGIPQEQVQQHTNALAQEAWTRCFEGECARCGSTKLVIKRRISSFAC